METNAGHYLDNHVQRELFRSYISINKVTTVEELFETAIGTVSRVGAEIIEIEKKKVDAMAETHKCKTKWWKVGEMIFFTWNGDNLTTINELKSETVKYKSNSFRFGYVTEKGEIILLFSGNYIAKTREDAVALYPYVCDWVKENYLSEATVFAQIMY